jgi:RNA polymerase sigma-70 factor, ECF subfamily
VGSGERPVEGRPLEDAELVALARDGDVRAYGELVSRYQGIAHRVAWLVARQAGEAEDAVQEAFVKAYDALPGFRADAPFRPWILRIVANEARNRARSARRREGLALRAAAVALGDAAPSPETAAVAREDAEALTRALARLREPDRLVIAYRYLFELSEAETAGALGIRRGTVKSRLSRALGRLRTELESAGASPEEGTP